MKTLIALLLLIPSLSWGKDLGGIKLWCKYTVTTESIGTKYVLFDFINKKKVIEYSLSKNGINKKKTTYKIYPAYIIVGDRDFTDRIERQSLTSRFLDCKLIEISDVEDYLNNRLEKEFMSKNKI